MRISDFTLRNLRTFCAVAEHGGFLGAQAMLGMSQPAISAHIKDLEVGLGFSLCRRGRGGFALTEKGKDVYAHAKEMLSGVEDCEARLGALRQVLTGHLRVGLVDSEADNPDLPVHRAIRRFFSREQEVRLSLEVGTPEALAKALQTGEVHVAIGPFPNRQPNIDYSPIYVEEHALFCGRDHPLFMLPAAEITTAMLSPYPMTVRPYLQRAELSALQDAHVTASVSNMEAQAILIRSGCFLGFLPVHFARKWLNDGQMRRIDLPGLGWRSQFHIAQRVQPEPTGIARLFVRDVKQELIQHKE
ncbi:LysR family transcriptional regulator [Paracoccus onubensis]|uniref:LysR family transcriptional regulator n=1 Tax=Paracoccus onubensis TaxID=1675788 RepID=UPI002731F4E8|nr:LysR family transcriptional regulator [Paracoccus onubensis]MDP0928641.1 LysR family transcriptional regulator [Paracoccus onubensis]